MRSGISIGESGGRASNLSGVVSGVGLEVPRCTFDPANELCVPLSVFRETVDRAHRHCAFSSWYDTVDHSKLMNRIQLVPSVIVLRHHLNDLPSKR